MEQLNWVGIATMLLAPLPLGILIALPLWRKQEGMLGNLAGAALIFGTAIVLILKESSESDALASRCLEAGLTDCFSPGGSFARFAIYAFIGLAEVIALFLISLNVEKRVRNRDVAPEWRSWGNG